MSELTRKASVLQLDETLILKSDERCWIINEDATEHGLLRCMQEAAEGREGNMEEMDRLMAVISPRFHPDLHELIIKKGRSVAELCPSGELMLHTQHMRHDTLLDFGMTASIMADDIDPYDEDEPTHATVSAPVGTRAEGGSARNATLIMGERHLAVELDGLTHLFSHDGLTHCGSSAKPFRPAPGDLASFTLPVQTSTKIPEFTLTVAPQSIFVDDGREDWSFNNDGLECNGHGQFL